MQIYVLNRARETLATTSGIYDDKHTLTLDAGSSSYEFKIDKADEASQYMDSGNYIVLQDDDGKTWLFTILDYEETQYTKTVYAEDAGIELLNKACDIWKADGPHSFEHYFEIVTSGTPWKLGVNQLAGLDRTLKYEGRDTGLGRLLSILKGFDDAECTFDVNVKMNAPSEFKINVYKRVGNDRSDVQMVYNHELNDITKKESRAEFVTALCGVGGTVTPPEGQETTEQENISFADLEYNKDGLVTTKGDKFLRAVDANKRFNPGQTTYIEAFYEYDTQSASELLNRTITRLKTYSEPQYTYTADVKIIDSTLKIGDTVTIIDHDYNPALYLSARVAKLEKSYTDPSQNTIEFCNYQLLSSRLADKLAKLQTIVNKMPSASQVGKLESNVTNLSTKTEELASQITSANGKNTNYYGKTEPASPKNGDLWYKKLENGEVEMYQYQDGTWQLLASTADLTTVQTELDQAKSDMEQAKTDAQTAYDEAIKATNTANGAKAQTVEALEQARQANDNYTALAQEVADNKASMDADYQKAHDSYTNLAKEVADNKSSIDADYQKAQADIKQANDNYAALAQEVTDNKASVDADYKQVSDDYTALVKEVADNKASVDADYKKIQADVAQAKKDLSSVTGTVTEVKKGQGELSAKVAGKVDNTVYQTYVEQTNQALSEKLIASDLQSYAKIADVKQTTDGLSANITKVQGDLNGLQIGGANLLDGSSLEKDIGSTTGYDTNEFKDGWRLFTNKTAKTSRNVYSIPVKLTKNQYVFSVDFKCISKTSSPPAYVQLMFRDTTDYSIYGTNGEQLITLGETRLSCTSNIPNGKTVNFLQITISSSFVGQIAIRHVKLEKGNKATDWCVSDNDVQSQINTLSGKITATSDRLSSVYTKSETDKKLGTKVEQSTLTQTSNTLSASIAGNTDKITKLTADVNGVKSTVASKVDNTVYQTYVEQTNQSLSEKLVASDLSGYAKTVDVTKSIDGVKTIVADNKGKISTMQTDINGVKTNVRNAQGDISSLQADAKSIKATVSDHTGKITQLTTDVNGIKTTVGDVQGNVATLQADAKSIKTTVADHTGKISTMQTDVNGVKTNVENAQGDITSIQTDVSGVKTTVADHTGKITQLTTDVNGVKSSVSSKVDKTVYQSYVTQTDKALSAKLTASDLKGYAKTADVKQTTDGLSASITKVQGDLSSLQIGGANLLDGSSLEKNIGNSSGFQSNEYADGWRVLTSTSATGSRKTYSIPVKLTKNQYAFSVDFKCVSKTSSPPGYVQLMFRDTTDYSIYGTNGEQLITLGETRLSCTSNIPNGKTVNFLQITISSSFVGQIALKNVKLESGNRPTDWCMSDNDVQSQLDTLSGKITATSDRLSSVYTKSEVDGKLGTKVEQSALTQTSNNLSASIAKNSKILSSIGLTSDTAYINANKIALNGKTLMSNAVINDAFIGNLSANKITTGTLNAAKVNVINLDASKITTGTLTAVDIHQSSAGADTWINNDGIHNQMGSNNVWIKRGTLAAFDSSGQGMFMESGQLTLASYAYWQNAGNPESIDYGIIKCDDDITGKKGIGVIGKGGFSLRTNNSDLNGWAGNEYVGSVTAGAGIIGTEDGKLLLGSLKPTFIEGGWGFEGHGGYSHTPFIQVGGRMDKAGADIDKNGSSIVLSAWDIKLNACGKDNRNIILNRLTYNGEHSIDLNDGSADLWWGPKMHAPAFVNTSALSKKMNITKLDTQAAINAIKNTDIYDYQFKEFGETGKHYASLIIDDVNDKPQYKAAGAFVDGLGRDDGTQLGYLTVVVQNLLEEIDTLKERIDK